MGRKIARTVVTFLVVLLVLYGVLALTAVPRLDLPYFEHDDALAIAHRGGRGLWPENTMYAFERAAALGVDVLEMDIHSTADGVLVTMHDDLVDRTTNGRGPIHDHTLAELLELDAGYNWTADDGATFAYRGQGVTVATLDELFAAFPGMRMNIEIKQREPSIVAPFCQLIRQYGREEQVLVGSFHPDVVAEFARECPGVPLVGTEPQIRAFYILNTIFLGRVYRAPAAAFQVPEYNGNTQVVTERFVRGAHHHNIQVHVWTVNEPADMQRLIELGVDGLISDYPDRLLAVLGR
jgi:glycerophosphoryl diester phosphodiesterase